MTEALRLSVVVATYERPSAVRRLLAQLTAQSLRPETYEIVVVDDGSTMPVDDYLSDLRPRYGKLTVARRENGGAAAARDEGVRLAGGDILLMLDDDMQVGPRFLEAHLAHHRGEEHMVVLGRIRPDHALPQMPIFERFHAAQLAGLQQALEMGVERPRGRHLYTGNVSMRRRDYLAVGGFDHTLKRSEDRELGLRLEAYGAKFTYAFGEADSIHSSDHTDGSAWLERAWQYGINEVRVARKHPSTVDADPWSFMRVVSPLARPFYSISALEPSLGRGAGRLALKGSEIVDGVGVEKAALTLATLAYGMTYFGGVGSESGGPAGVMKGLAREVCRTRLSTLPRWLEKVRADHEQVRRYRLRYADEKISQDQMSRHLVEKIGFQMMALVRLMQVLREDGSTGPAKTVSRLIRHLYSADVHWDAHIEPGVVVVHGMGQCISPGARIGSGCILFQNVTLGEGADPVSRLVGSPVIEKDVHVGPGATIIGPVTVGAGSKVMAGAVVTGSVPAGSLVKAGDVSIQPRPVRGAFSGNASDDRKCSRSRVRKDEPSSGCGSCDCSSKESRSNPLTLGQPHSCPSSCGSD